MRRTPRVVSSRKKRRSTYRTCRCSTPKAVSYTHLDVSKRQEQGIRLLVGLGRGNERNLHTEDLGDLVHVDLREDDLLGDAEGIVTLAVELLIDTLEIADTGKCHGDQALEEFVHLRIAQRCV